MTKREELEKIINQLNDIDKTNKGLYDQKFDLSQIKNDLGLEVLKEEKLLKGTKWNVRYWDGNGPYFILDYVDGSDDVQIDKIKKLLNLHYHDIAHINKDIILKISDNDTMIDFKKIEALKQFIEEHEIIVSCDDLNQKIEEYNKISKILKKFIKKFNG